jgi:hypothetical protein
MLTAPVVNLDLYLVTRRGSQAKSTSLEFTARLKATAAKLAAPPPKSQITRKLTGKVTGAEFSDPGSIAPT